MVNYCADIMMVTYNRLNLTKQTLESFLKTTDCNFNLIIIDNASTDGTVDYIRRFCEENKGTGYFKSYVIKENNKNLGIATGRNQGLMRSKEDWLVTFDNDIIVPNGWLSECINLLSENKQYGTIGVNFENIQYPIIKLNNRELQDKVKGNLGTACMCFHRNIHKMFGFFNTKDYSPLYALEDGDFGMRLYFAGFKRGYITRPGVHLGDGENDQGEYRKIKTREHNKYLPKFQENCQLYAAGKKSIYIPFEDIY